MAFDKLQYDKQYRAENYKQIAFRCNAADVDYIKQFAKKRNLSIPLAILKAFKYIDMHNIDISDNDDIIASSTNTDNNTKSDKANKRKK